MVSDKNTANAIGAKTARACDYCVRKRARWYCAADDAFLCQVCDSTVHSANPLARRHERVQLNTASLNCSSDKPCIPSWHRGLNKKARTPRHGKQHCKPNYQAPYPLIVPELDHSASHDDDNEEDQLLYRVPIFDPFEAELCNSITTSKEHVPAGDVSETVKGQPKYFQSIRNEECSSSQRFLPSKMDLDEFEADVETLLGKGLDGESYGIEELGLLDCQERDSMDCSMSNGRGSLVKAEQGEGKVEEIIPSSCHMEGEIDVMREPFELSFDYNCPTTCEEEDVKVVVEPVVRESEGVSAERNSEKKEWRISLQLDYEAISKAWQSQGSPWLNGERPMINPDDCWLHGSRGDSARIQPFAEMGMIGGQARRGDGGREARVSRYREKRRTRLFSKKIRYEVRKLNAEKRPRMKGRFVKRSSFTPTLAPFPLPSK